MTWRQAFGRPAPYIVVYATTLHLGWFVLLAFRPEQAAWATPTAAIVQALGYVGGLLALVGASIAAGAALSRPTTTGMLLLLPQQTILVISASGALRAAVQGHYADGVARPGAFILADQLPVVVLMLCHWWALVRHA